MGSFSSKKTVTTVGEGSIHDGKVLQFAVSRNQGRRPSMEDADVTSFGLGPHKHIALFAVFDGHGGKAGARCSRFLSENVQDVLVEHLTSHKTEDMSKHDLKEALIQAFYSLDQKLFDLPPFEPGDVIMGCYCSPRKTFIHAGSTAEVMLVTPTVYAIGNLGDSRVAICRKGGVAFCTVDHKPWEESELKRIKDSGSFMENKRIKGDLAVSRTLGDFAHKSARNLSPEHQAVSCVPWITLLDRIPGDEFVIVACDGVWDVMDEQQAVDFVRPRVMQGMSLSKISEELIEEALRLGTMDNLTCIVILIDNKYKQWQEDPSFNDQQRYRQHSYHESIIMDDEALEVIQPELQPPESL